eukprot:5051705-Pyramimonas_sp.AAC.1
MAPWLPLCVSPFGSPASLASALFNLKLVHSAFTIILHDPRPTSYPESATHPSTASQLGPR